MASQFTRVANKLVSRPGWNISARLHSPVGVVPLPGRKKEFDSVTRLVDAGVRISTVLAPIVNATHDKPWNGSVRIDSKAQLLPALPGRKRAFPHINSKTDHGVKVNKTPINPIPVCDSMNDVPEEVCVNVTMQDEPVEDMSNANSVASIQEGIESVPRAPLPQVDLPESDEGFVSSPEPTAEQLEPEVMEQCPAPVVEHCADTTSKAAKKKKKRGKRGLKPMVPYVEVPKVKSTQPAHLESTAPGPVTTNSSWLADSIVDYGDDEDEACFILWHTTGTECNRFHPLLEH